MDLSYGFIRWAMGYFCGSALVGACLTTAEYPRISTALFGVAIVLFFADYHISERP